MNNVYHPKPLQQPLVFSDNSRISLQLKKRQTKDGRVDTGKPHER